MKPELFNILNEPNDKLIAVDMDGTLCHGVWWGPEDKDPEPHMGMIELVWKLYRKGAHIVIYTARQPRYYSRTHAWLIKHEVPFHGITMCMKPGADLYLDDRAINIDDLVETLEVI